MMTPKKRKSYLAQMQEDLRIAIGSGMDAAIVTEIQSRIAAHRAYKHNWYIKRKADRASA